MIATETALLKARTAAINLAGGLAILPTAVNSEQSSTSSLG